MEPLTPERLVITSRHGRLATGPTAGTLLCTNRLFSAHVLWLAGMRRGLSDDADSNEAHVRGEIGIAISRTKAIQGTGMRADTLVGMNFRIDATVKRGRGANCFSPVIGESPQPLGTTALHPEAHVEGVLTMLLWLAIVVGHVSISGEICGWGSG